MLHLMNLLELRKIVDKTYQKIKMCLILWFCLNYVNQNPGDYLRVGVRWINQCEFIINNNTFANFIKSKRSTINRRLQLLNFKSTKMNKETQKRICKILKIPSLPGGNQWVIRSGEGFTQLTTKDEADSIHPISSKKDQKKNEENNNNEKNEKNEENEKDEENDNNEKNEKDEADSDDGCFVNNNDDFFGMINDENDDNNNELCFSLDLNEYNSDDSIFTSSLFN